MDAVKVLLCDLGTDNGAAENIRAILETDSHHRFAFQHEVLGASDRLVVVRRLAKFRSKLRPAISFLFCGAAQPPAIEEPMKALRADRADRPVLVVAETRDPDTVAELFRLGATEVFTPPLRAIDLIPRVWRWIEANGEEDES